MMKRILNFCAALLIVAYNVPLPAMAASGGINYTSATTWGGKSFSNPGVTLDPLYYSGTPSFSDTLGDCTHFGQENFAHDSNATHKLWANNGSAGGLAGVLFTSPVYTPTMYDCGSTSSVKMTLQNLTDTFTASITGTDMNVTSVQTGGVRVGATVTGAGVAANTKVNFIISGSSGGVGHYNVSVSQTLGSTAMTTQQWYGGQLFTDNRYGDGFRFTYGYAEVSIKLASVIPTGVCPWWAFWLNGPQYNTVGAGKSKHTNPEIDFEGCLHIAGTNDLTLTHWSHSPTVSPAPSGEITVGRYIQPAAPTAWAAKYDDAFHTYGFLRTPTVEKWFVDHVEVAEIAITGNEERLPVMAIIDLANYFSLSGASTASTYTAEFKNLNVYPCPAGHVVCD